MSILVQYQRGYAGRVMDVFGTSGFNVSENGQLGYFGEGGPWHADPGDWIFRNDDDTLACSPTAPSERRNPPAEDVYGHNL